MTDRPDESTEHARAIIDGVLRDGELEYLEPEPGAFVVNLPGERRLKTACWLTVGRHGLRIEAFVVRKPDENTAAVHRWLLAHNARSYLVSWSIDDAGDIYLTGTLPLAAVNAEQVDTILGVVLDHADSAFNTLLEIGFGSSIRREWAWRESRGESLANLAAFAGFVSRSNGNGA